MRTVSHLVEEVISSDHPRGSDSRVIWLYDLIISTWYITPEQVIILIMSIYSKGSNPLMKRSSQIVFKIGIEIRGRSILKTQLLVSLALFRCSFQTKMRKCVCSCVTMEKFKWAVAITCNRLEISQTYFNYFRVRSDFYKKKKVALKSGPTKR